METGDSWDSGLGEWWPSGEAGRALDDLLSRTLTFKSSKAYLELVQFVARFQWYSPFNAMLVRIQMPGATFVATAERWLRDYGRVLKPGARPLVMLQPRGRVMFVFDVSDTEGRPLPEKVETPFKVTGLLPKERLELTIKNCRRDGVEVHYVKSGSQRGGQISSVPDRNRMTAFSYTTRTNGKLETRTITVPLRYIVEISEQLDLETRYAVLAHELGHLYCGHLGTPNPRWWPDRSRVKEEVEEFEAESVAYLACMRAGVKTKSEAYLAGYAEAASEIPSISVDCVMKAAGLIETMGTRALRPRPSVRIRRKAQNQPDTWT